jgi:hypothetical protein
MDIPRLWSLSQACSTSTILTSRQCSYTTAIAHGDCTYTMLACTGVFKITERMPCAHELLTYLEEGRVVTKALFDPHHCFPRDSTTTLEIEHPARLLKLLNPLRRRTARQARALRQQRGTRRLREPTLAERLDPTNTAVAMPTGMNVVDLTHTQAEEGVDEATMNRRNGLPAISISQQRNTRAPKYNVLEKQLHRCTLASHDRILQSVGA